MGALEEQACAITASHLEREDGQDLAAVHLLHQGSSAVCGMPETRQQGQCLACCLLCAVCIWRRHAMHKPVQMWWPATTSMASARPQQPYGACADGITSWAARTVEGEEGNEEAKAASALGNAGVALRGGQAPEEDGQREEQQRGDDVEVEGAEPQQEGLGRRVVKRQEGQEAGG